MYRDLIKEIKDCEPVVKKDNGSLDFSSFKEVYYKVNKAAKLAYQDEKKDLLQKRRNLLKKDDNEGYAEVVAEMSKREEEVLNQHMMQVMDYLGYLESDYQKMYKGFMGSPDTQNQLIQAQANPFTSGSKKGPAITLDRAKKIYIYSEEAKTEALKSLVE